jgi:hypothetical protein
MNEYMHACMHLSRDPFIALSLLTARLDDDLPPFFSFLFPVLFLCRRASFFSSRRCKQSVVVGEAAEQSGEPSAAGIKRIKRRVGLTRRSSIVIVGEQRNGTPIRQAAAKAWEIRFALWLPRSPASRSGNSFNARLAFVAGGRMRRALRWERERGRQGD